MPTTVEYEFDPTGTLLANRITGESKTPTPSAYNAQLLVVPDASPFFALGLEVRRADTLALLDEGTDYLLSHCFDTASINTAKPIYGSISFFDNGYNGAVYLNYQTLGGPWVLTTNEALEQLYNKLINPREAYWEQVVDLPMYFPHIDHGHNAEDTTTYADLIAAIESVALAVETSNEENSEYATLEEALDGVRTDRIMSPANTKIVVTNAISASLNGNVQAAYLLGYGRERELVRSLMGTYLFIDTPTIPGLKLTRNASNWVIKAGVVFIDGMMIRLSNDLTLTNPPAQPQDLWLVVTEPDGIASGHNTPTFDFIWNTADTALAYDSGGRLFQSFKVSRVTTNTNYSDLRIVQRAEKGVLFTERNPTLEMVNNGDVLVKNRLTTVYNDTNVAIEVKLPNVSAIDPPLYDKDWVEVERQGLVRIMSYNGVSDQIRLEKPNGAFVIGEGLDFNLNTRLRFRWNAADGYWEV